MVERQYIGARYVPKFFENPVTHDSTWMQGVAYEPLTIVTYASNSYTSKRPVPAGIGAPNLNAEYWVSTGMYNAQIEELREMITNSFPVDSSQIGDGAVTADKIATGAVTKDKLRSKKCIFIADSYGNYTNAGGLNYIALACQYLGIPSSNYFDFHLGSSGFGRDGQLSFYSVLSSNDSVITDKSAITDIFVFGGANDQVVSVDAILTGMSNFMTYVKLHYPNATVHIGCVSRTYEAEYGMNFIRTIRAYQSCGTYGAVYLTGSECIMADSAMFRGDHVHPTEASIPVLAMYCANLIETGACSVTSNEITDSTFAINPNNTVQGTLRRDSSFIRFHNGCEQIGSRIAGPLVSINVTIASASAGENALPNILKLIRCFIPPTKNNECYILTDALVTHDGGTSLVPIVLYFDSASPMADGSYSLSGFWYPPTALTNVSIINVYGNTIRNI